MLEDKERYQVFQEGGTSHIFVPSKKWINAQSLEVRHEWDLEANIERISSQAYVYASQHVGYRRSLHLRTLLRDITDVHTKVFGKPPHEDLKDVLAELVMRLDNHEWRSTESDRHKTAAFGAFLEFVDVGKGCTFTTHDEEYVLAKSLFMRAAPYSRGNEQQALFTIARQMHLYALLFAELREPEGVPFFADFAAIVEYEQRKGLFMDTCPETAIVHDHDLFQTLLAYDRNIGGQFDLQSDLAFYTFMEQKRMMDAVALKHFRMMEMMDGIIRLSRTAEQVVENNLLNYITGAIDFILALDSNKETQADYTRYRRFAGEYALTLSRVRQEESK